MSEAIYSTFGVTFLASPLGEGERTKVRGSKRATRNCPENPHPPPLPFEGRGDLSVSSALGPGRAHMAYCRTLLPHLLDVSRLRIRRRFLFWARYAWVAR
jgi:hypothetical protein